MLKLKENSHRRILNLIRHHGQISGAELARITNLQPSTLVYILRYLDQKKLIRVSGQGSSTLKGGKRPVLWQINEQAGFLIGMELLKSRLRAVLVNLAGDISMRVEKDFSAAGPEKYVQLISETCLQMMKEASASPSQILNLSVGVPGIVDIETQSIRHASVLNLYDVDIKTPIAKATGLPVSIVNDANAGALGELWYPQTDNEAAQNILYLTYNQSARDLGLGIVLDARLYTGLHSTAGEIISEKPDMVELLEKHLPAFAEDQVILSVDNLRKKRSLDELARAWKKGCPLATAIITEIADYLAVEISRLTGLLNPQRVVIGGEITLCHDLPEKLMIPRIREIIDKHSGYKLQVPEIVFSPFSVYSVSIGSTAAFLAQELGA